MSVRRTAVKGNSYSRGEYPTPSATPYGTSQNEGKVPHKRPTAGTPSLETWARQLDWLWSTPTASDGVGGPGHGAMEGGESLRTQASDWTTPTTQDAKNEASESQRRRKGSALHIEAQDISLHATTLICGPACRRSLSPLFVEALMGLPPRWSTARIGFTPSATELSRWLERSRSACSRVVSELTNG
jgi:hypothetical protein